MSSRRIPVLLLVFVFGSSFCKLSSYAFTPILHSTRSQYVPFVNHQPSIVIRYQSSSVTPTQESPLSDSSNNESSSTTPSTQEQQESAPAKRVYTTSATAAAAAGRRVLPNTPQTQQRTNSNNSGGRGGDYSRPNNRSYTTPSNPDRRYNGGNSATQQQQSPRPPRSYTTAGVNGRTGNQNAPPRSYDSTLQREPRNFGSTDNSGVPPLKLLNPLRLVRIVEQTPGTNEEIYSSERGGGGGRRDSDGGGGRGPRPTASAGGISTFFSDMICLVAGIDTYPLVSSIVSL